MLHHLSGLKNDLYQNLQTNSMSNLKRLKTVKLKT